VWVRITDIDLSKILEGKTQILVENVVKTDKCMGVSQILGPRGARAAPPKSTPMVWTSFNAIVNPMEITPMARDNKHLDFLCIPPPCILVHGISQSLDVKYSWKKMVGLSIDIRKGCQNSFGGEIIRRRERYLRKKDI